MQGANLQAFDLDVALLSGGLAAIPNPGLLMIDPLVPSESNDVIKITNPPCDSADRTICSHWRGTVDSQPRVTVKYLELRIGQGRNMTVSRQR